MHYQTSEKSAETRTENKFITSLDLVHKLNRYKWIYLFLLAAFFTGTFFLFKYKVLKYSATATFFMSDPVVNSIATNESKQIDFINHVENVNRVYQLVRSTEVLDHLIKKFGLLKHYDIDTTEEFYYEQAITILYDRMDVKKNPTNSISITVKDSYRYMAADLANEAVSYVDELNKKLLSDKINRKVAIYAAMLTDLRKESAMPAQQADSLLHQVNAILSHSGHEQDKPILMTELQVHLNKLSYDLHTSTEDLIQTQRYYSMMLHTVEKDNLPTFTLIDKAQASHHSLIIESAGLAGGLTLLFASLIILFQFLVLKYSDHIRIFIPKR